MKCEIAVVLVGVLAVVLGASVRSQGEFAGASPYIIGGHVVKHMDRPYAARLKFTTEDSKLVRYCGAARLDRVWFITAAECLSEERSVKMELMYPDPNTANFDYDARIFIIKNLNYTIHPQYNYFTNVHNIAVFQCKYCSSLPDFGVLPQLPRKSEKNATFSNLSVTVAGWTVPRVSSETRNNITSFDTTMVIPSVCKIMYSPELVESGHICASSLGGKQLNENDVGVPMVAKVSEPNSRLTLIGIADSELPWATWLPTVFTNIAPAAEWISQVTGIQLRD